jgi:hypothetical protein
MTGLRRTITQKITTKRWAYYHALHRASLFPEGYDCKIPVGRYKKAKGCECRMCTWWKYEAKHDAKKARRRENRELKMV